MMYIDQHFEILRMVWLVLLSPQGTVVLGVNTRLAVGIYSAIVGSILTRPCSFYPI